MRKRNNLVCGIGVSDAEYPLSIQNKGKLDWRCPYYTTWHSMIVRCYSDKLKLKRPTYKGCKVCDDWLKFSNFKGWMEKQDWEGKQLDKDLLIPDNKVYSPTTSIFIERKLNLFLTDHKKNRGQYQIGVYWDKNAGKFKAQCSDGNGGRKYLGLFTCANEAHESWRAFKHEIALNLADEQTDPRIAHALRQWYKPNGWYKNKEAN